MVSGMPRPRKSLRQELLDAQAKIERQLEILSAGPHEMSWQPGTVEQMKVVLAEIKQQLEEIDSENPHDDQS